MREIKGIYLRDLVEWNDLDLGEKAAKYFWQSYLIIICPKSHEMLTISEIMSSWSRFEHCSKSLV